MIAAITGAMPDYRDDGSKADALTAPRDDGDYAHRRRCDQCLVIDFVCVVPDYISSPEFVSPAK